MKYALLIFGVLAVAVLLVGTARDPNFWRTPDQRGDALLRARHFDRAAKMYADPARIAAAQYRNGDFERAAKTFARVPGSAGAFDRGNALLMHGKYPAAIVSYDRALGFRPGWKEAEENRAIAVARQAALDASSKNRAAEAADAYEPDKIVVDQKGDDRKARPIDLAQQDVSDEALRATWLRQVQTTPRDFLRAKLAYQAAHPTGGKEARQ